MSLLTQGARTSRESRRSSSDPVWRTRARTEPVPSGPEGYTYSVSAFRAVDPVVSDSISGAGGPPWCGRSWLGPPASPRLARVERRARQGPGNRGPPPPTSGAPSARRPTSLSLERPALPRRGEHHLARETWHYPSPKRHPPLLTTAHALVTSARRQKIGGSGSEAGQSAASGYRPCHTETVDVGGGPIGSGRKDRGGLAGQWRQAGLVMRDQAACRT
jgi:hypothetical protein